MSYESILLAGEFHPDRLGASYERAFKQLGHALHRFDLVSENASLAWPARNRVLHRIMIGNLTARRAWSRRFNLRLIEQAQAVDAEWVFLHNGMWVMPETVRELRRQGRKVAIFHADNPFLPHYNYRPENLPAAREASLYLVWSDRLVARLRTENVNAHFLAFGWDPVVMPYQADIPRGTWPGVVFIGGWDREREIFLDELAKHVPLRIFGPNYWGTRARRGGRARNCWQGRALGLAESARVIRESAVCLNILRTQHIIDGHPDGVIMRHFEVPGAGGMLLSTRSGVATSMFPELQSGVYFDNVIECVEQCHRLIRNAGQRNEIAENAHTLTLGRYTYTHRASEVVQFLREAS